MMALEQDKLPASPTEGPKALSDKEQEESRLDSRDQEDKLSGILLHICSWNPDADTKLDAYLKKKWNVGRFDAPCRDAARNNLGSSEFPEGVEVS